MNEPKSFYLIDGSSYIYRAFYALGRLTNSKGMPTQAVYGFAQMLLKVIRDKSPDYVCVVFDAPGPTFRHEVYKEYKATRQKMPEDLVVQIPYIKDLVKYFGVPQVELESYEADDLIGLMADWGSERGLEVVIVSGDKDLHQLIRDPQVVQWDPQRDRVFTEAGVFERFGITPAQMIDYLALVGDSTDNVPGVKGVGDKTARQLLQQWGSLDAIYARLDEITPPGVKKKLAQHKDDAYLSRDLVSLRKDAPLNPELEKYVPASRMKQELAKLYEELGFKSLLDALRQEGGDAEDRPPLKEKKDQENQRKDRIITRQEDLAELVRRIEGEKHLSVDLETTSRDPMLAGLVGIALCFEDNSAYYIPLAHRGPGSGEQLSEPEVLKALAPLLAGSKVKKVGQNLKYEWVVLERHGVELHGIEFDTMVASYLLDPGKRAHDLERIAAEHLGESMISYSDVTGSGKAQVGFAEIDVAKAAEYACEDAETTWRLVPMLKNGLRENGMEELYTSLELPLLEVLARMERRGILVDGGELEDLSLDFEKSMDQRAGRIFELAREEFNIQSPKQLASILFEKLGLPVIKKTKTGPSTDVSVLEDLAGEHPIVEQVLAYRSLAKLKGTYLDALPKLIHPKTGRIHTSYNQTVAATGRLSSSDPNLQNIPIRTEEGRKIRKAFVAAPGHVLLSADYSQVELRILAHYSGDEHLVEAFQAGEDVHTRTAAEMLGIPPLGVTPEMRRQAKMINFGIIYGMGAFGLARRLKISNKTAKAAIDRYFERYTGVKRFIEESIQTARERGYCESFLGRRRAIPELHSRNHTIRQQGERLAINTPIQSTAADLIKKAMIDVDKELREGGFRTAMLLQVHDELVFEAPLDELERVKEMIRDKMEHVWKLSVPIKVDMGWGENWAKAHS
jgi:DNA polymerase-1